MLSLLRLVNAITDSVGTGLCVVLSLTVDWFNNIGRCIRDDC